MTRFGRIVRISSPLCFRGLKGTRALRCTREYHFPAWQVIFTPFGGASPNNATNLTCMDLMQLSPSMPCSALDLFMTGGSRFSEFRAKTCHCYFCLSLTAISAVCPYHPLSYYSSPASSGPRPGGGWAGGERHCGQAFAETGFDALAVTHSPRRPDLTT